MRQTRINLVIITCILIAIGIVMIYSASAIYAFERMKDSTHYLKRHLLYLVLGVLVTLTAMRIDYTKLRKYIKPSLLISIVLLILVLIPGISREIGGARRWFRFIGTGFQPSEFAKLALILYMADILDRKQSVIRSFRYGFLPPMIVLGLLIGLVLLQPDLGTAASFVLVSFIMLFVAEVNLIYIVPFTLAAIPALYFLIFKVSYRRRRIVAFLDPWADPKGAGFQIIQSFVALGSGGLLGVGLGQSRQKLFYLPESHTDFIFSIIGEELGLLGTVAVVVLFILFIWQGMRIAVKAKDLFGQLLALGIVSMIFLEVAINIGVATGTIPTKGLPLPFISYGGSNLIFNMVGVGLLLNIAKERKFLS